MEGSSNSNVLSDNLIQRPLAIRNKSFTHYRQGNTHEGLSCSLESQTTSLKRTSLSKYFSKARSFSCLSESLDGPLGESAKALEKSAKRSRHTCKCSENRSKKKCAKVGHANDWLDNISDLEDLCNSMQKCPFQGKDEGSNNSVHNKNTTVDGADSVLRSDSSCSSLDVAQIT